MADFGIEKDWVDAWFAEDEEEDEEESTGRLPYQTETPRQAFERAAGERTGDRSAIAPTVRGRSYADMSLAELVEPDERGHLGKVAVAAAMAGVPGGGLMATAGKVAQGYNLDTARAEAARKAGYTVPDPSLARSIFSELTPFGFVDPNRKGFEEAMAKQGYANMPSAAELAMAGLSVPAGYPNNIGSLSAPGASAKAAPIPPIAMQIALSQPPAPAAPIGMVDLGIGPPGSPHAGRSQTIANDKDGNPTGFIGGKPDPFSMAINEALDLPPNHAGSVTDPRTGRPISAVYGTPPTAPAQPAPSRGGDSGGQGPAPGQSGFEGYGGGGWSTGFEGSPETGGGPASGGYGGGAGDQDSGMDAGW